MKKNRIVALLLLLCTVITMSAVPSGTAAAETDTGITIQQVVMALEIMMGDGEGNMRLDNTLTRAEFSRIVIQMSPKRNTVSGTSATSPFPDVPATHWAAAYVREAVKSGYLAGYPNGTFRPAQNVKVEEVATAFLAILGYSASDYGSGYPSAQMGYAKSLGLLDDVSAVTGGEISRRDMLQMCYNTLAATTKTGTVHITTLGYATDMAGKIDDEAIIADSYNDPITVTDSGWQTAQGVKSAYVTVFRNDRSASLSDIQTRDVVYYSPKLNTVKAYSTKTTGVLQSISPSRTSAASVTVSGMTYAIDGKNASDALKNADNIEIGDTVILLLGEEGAVSDILVPSGGSASIYGYASASGTTTAGAYYITFIATDGRALQYQVTADPKSYVGRVVKLTISGGAVTVSRADTIAVSGVVDASAYTIGGQAAARDVNILEVDSSGGYTATYLGQLNGVTLSENNVLYYAMNSAGKISDLIITGISSGSFGPITVKSKDWYQGTGLIASSAIVYKNDDLSSLSGIAVNDIVYYSITDNTVWAYDRKTTGILQNVLPSRVSPTSIVVSGMTYTLEGNTAKDAFGASGGIRLGDTITLLLGEEGEVADVLTVSGSATVTGYALSAGTTLVTDTDDSAYSSYYINLAMPDGRELQYLTSNDASYFVGALCKLTFKDGTANVSQTSGNGASLSGTVDAAARTIGSYSVSDSLSIVDVDDYGNMATIFLPRLDGLALARRDVLYYSTNGNGDISEIILKEVTGDTYSYGVVTSVDDITSDEGDSTTFAYDIGGAKGTASTASKQFEVKTGPARLIFENGVFQKYESLSRLNNVSLTDYGYITVGGSSYKLADKVLIYKYSAGAYTLLSQSQAKAYNGSLAAYYDAAESTGGRIRVLVATA